MQRPNVPVSLADLSAGGIELRPYEAVTIVRELISRVARGELAGVPSSHVIRLAGNGEISIEGPVGAGGPSVARAGQLLDSLLPQNEGASQFRVPGGLRLVIARAMGALDLPPFASLEAFTAALERFASSDCEAMVSNLVAAWADASGARAGETEAGTSQPVPVAQVESFDTPRSDDDRIPVMPTVSDVRRARRATGLTLDQLSERTGIPTPLLRQLEWGYLVNWPAGRQGRTLLKRYARAAGLDPQAVLTAVAPLLLEAAQMPVLAGLPPPPPRVSDERVAEAFLSSPMGPTIAERPAPARRSGALAALSIAALLLIALLPAWRAATTRIADDATASQATGQPAPQSQAAGSAAPPPDAAPPPAAQPAEAEPAAAAESGASTPAQDRARQDSRAPVRSTGDMSYRAASDGSEAVTPLASVGTAMFYPAGEDDAPAVVPANTDGRDSVLRITKIVDDTADNLHLRLSPDRSRIAFDSNRDGMRGVYVADGDGKNVRRVSGDGFAAFPSWSPDGRSLAFVREELSRPGVWNVWTLDLASGALTQLTQHRSGQPRGASWFPDSRRLAYTQDQRLVIRDARSDTQRVFASPRRGRDVRSPAVSPDGRLIMFHVERDGGWLLDLRDASMRRVLEEATAEEYTWSPDGRRVAYAHYRDKTPVWGVWVMAPR